MASLGERVRSRRQAAGLSIEKLAVAANVGMQCVWSVEKRGTVPQAQALLRIAQALGCTVEFLLTGDDVVPARAVVQRAAVGK